MGTIGLDVHRSVARIAVDEDGWCRDKGPISLKSQTLRYWAAKFLEPDDEVALEAITNCDAIAAMLRLLVAQVVVSNP